MIAKKIVVADLTHASLKFIVVDLELRNSMLYIESLLHPIKCYAAGNQIFSNIQESLNINTE